MEEVILSLNRQIIEHQEGALESVMDIEGEMVDQEVQVMPQQMRWVDQMEVTLMEVVTPIIRNVLQVQGKGIPLEILESQAENVMQGVVAVLDGVLADPAYNKGGASDYAAGSGSDNLSGNGGGGYGGGGGPRSAGGDGTVLIRGYKYQ